MSKSNSVLRGLGLALAHAGIKRAVPYVLNRAFGSRSRNSFPAQSVMPFRSGRLTRRFMGRSNRALGGRRFRRSGFGGFRRTFRRRFRRHSCRTARSLKKVELRSLHWKNQAPTTIAPIVDSSAAFSSALITNIAEGVEQTMRTGDRVSIHSIIVALHFTQNLTTTRTFATVGDFAGDTRFWVGIIMTKTNVATPPTVADIFQSNMDTPGNQVRNLNTIRDWKIVWQRNMKMRCINIIQNNEATITDAFLPVMNTIVMRFKVPLSNHAVRFASATATDGRLGNLFLCAYAHRLSTVAMTYSWRMRWTG